MKVYNSAYLTTLGCLLSLILNSGCGTEPGAVYFPRGEKGEAGEVGTTGPAGTNGQDATPVTVVQLCPGTTIYPTTYVEVAFCIGGKLWATYSANGGFSTEIPPGTYNSNGVGSSCTFTVSSNCEVTQ